MDLEFRDKGKGFGYGLERCDCRTSWGHMLLMVTLLAEWPMIHLPPIRNSQKISTYLSQHQEPERFSRVFCMDPGSVEHCLFPLFQ